MRALCRTLACTALLVSASTAPVAQLSRLLHGSGFHRRLVSAVDVALPAGAVCLLELEQALPRDVFADAYELAGLERTGALPPARVLGAVNVERPAPECQPSVVTLTATAAAPSAGGRAAVRVSLPLHARYPAPAAPGDALQATVTLPPPSLRLRCGAGEWRALEVAREEAEVVWRVPRGDGGAAAMVESVTQRCTLVAAALILGALYRSGRAYA